MMEPPFWTLVHDDLPFKRGRRSPLIIIAPYYNEIKC
jgi:hypothetical protein